MAKALQRRRGTNEEHKSFAGLEGEFTYDTTEKRIVAHDGSTAGGIPVAKKEELPVTASASSSHWENQIYKFADFGQWWDSGAWRFRGFSMLISSRVGETILLSVGPDDATSGSSALRLLCGYKKIASVYYSTSECAVYVVLTPWSNNVSAHVISNEGKWAAPSVTLVSALPEDAINVPIINFGSDEGSVTIGNSDGSTQRVSLNGRVYAELANSDAPLIVASQSGTTYIGFSHYGNTNAFIGVTASGEPLVRTDVDKTILYDGNYSNYVVAKSGSRGALAGYNTPESVSGDVTISGDSNDDTVVSSAVNVTIADGSSDQTWIKTVSLLDAGATVTLSSAWNWVGGEAPTISANSILVVKWCGSFGLANLVAGG